MNLTSAFAKGCKVKKNSLCNNPKIHATPLFHPTSLIYRVNTKSADWKFGLAHDKQVMMMITAPVIDLLVSICRISMRGTYQKIAALSMVGNILNPKILMKQAPSMYAR